MGSISAVLFLVVTCLHGCGGGPPAPSPAPTPPPTPAPPPAPPEWYCLSDNSGSQQSMALPDPIGERTFQGADCSRSGWMAFFADGGKDEGAVFTKGKCANCKDPHKETMTDCGICTCTITQEL